MLRRIGLLVCLVLATALFATAQQMMIDFSDMPTVNRPVPLPDDYPLGTGMTWDALYYVSPNLWSGAGPGFTTGPDVRVAFLGGDMCKQTPTICTASIKLPVAPNSTNSFQPISMNLSAGWANNQVVVIAYFHSQLVGQVTWNLTTDSQTFNFPSEWTQVTQLRFFPGPIQHASGSVVIYTFTLNMQQ